MADYFRLELDDYSAPAFTSFSKYYFGTFDEIREFIFALCEKDRSRNNHTALISAFRVYESGQTDAIHPVAHHFVPLLVPAQVLYREKIELANHAWEHLNTWSCTYNMRCGSVNSEHLWVECGGEFTRVVKAEFAGLCYEGLEDCWMPIGGRLWGFPCMLTGDEEKFWNRLAEPEKVFKTKEELIADWEAFTASPDPDFEDFCNDIFGDG